MAQIVLGAAGAVVGFYAGGPAGAAQGFALGYSLGGALYPKTQKAPPQPLMDLRVVGAEYGQPIPYGRGAIGVAGQVWWNSERHPITTTTTTGGKGDGGGVEQTTTTYTIDMLIGLTDNPIVGIRRIWNNGKLVYSAAADASTTTIDASAGSVQWTRMTVYTGADDQLPDPTYEAAVGSANAPAYRGRGSVFIEGLQLGQSGIVPNLTFEVVVDGELGTDTPLLDYELDSGQFFYIFGCAISPIGDQWLTVEDVSGETFPGRETRIRRIGTGEILQSIVWDESHGSNRHLFGCFDFDGESGWLKRLTSLAFQQNNTTHLVKLTRRGLQFVVDIRVAGASILVNAMMAANGVEELYWLNGSAQLGAFSNIDFDTGTCTNTSYSGSVSGTMSFLANGNQTEGRIYMKRVISSSNVRIGYWDTNAKAWTDLILYTSSPIGVGAVGSDDNIYIQRGTASQLSFIDKFSSAGALLGSVQIPGFSGSNILVNSMVLSGDNLWLDISQSSPSKAQYVWIIASAMTIQATFDKVSGQNGFLNHFGYNGSAMFPAGGSGTAATNLSKWPPMELIEIDPPTVQEVVEDLCERAGLDASQIDATALSSITRTVRSLAISQIAPTRQALELLASTYFFEMVESDKLKFVPRGGSSVVTIPYLDLGASAGDEPKEPLALRQSNDLELPAQIAVTYINVDNDYQPDTQYSDRLISAVDETVATVQMPIGMTPSEAKAVAQTMQLDQAASVVSAPISLLGNYCALEPTDPVTVTGPNGELFRMRLVKKTDSYPVLDFEAVLDDTSVLSQAGITDVDYSSSTVLEAPVETTMEMMDIPILQDEDNDAGFYVATKGSGTPYSGSAVFESDDDVEFERAATVKESAVMGLCSTVLGDWAGPRVFDEINTVTVDVGDGHLASTTRDAILNSQQANAMLIGSEVIQFRTATLVSTGVYTLSGLLRGSRGTEWAMTGHAGAERCVRLRKAGVRRVAMANNELGVVRYYKGVTLGRAVSTADSEEFTDNGVGLKPFSPFDLRATRDASNNITFTWQRRSRLSVRAIGTLGISVPLGEEIEDYRLRVYSSGTFATLVRTITASTPTASYTAAQQTTDGLTPGNPVNVRLYQRSAVVGNGTKLERAA